MLISKYSQNTNNKNEKENIIRHISRLDDTLKTYQSKKPLRWALNKALLSSSTRVRPLALAAAPKGTSIAFEPYGSRTQGSNSHSRGWPSGRVPVVTTKLRDNDTKALIKHIVVFCTVNRWERLRGRAREWSRLLGGRGGVETGGQLYIKEKLKHTNNVVDVLSKKS